MVNTRSGVEKIGRTLISISLDIVTCLGIRPCLMHERECGEYRWLRALSRLEQLAVLLRVAVGRAIRLRTCSLCTSFRSFVSLCRCGPEWPGAWRKSRLH